jgi:hypothetical protein
MNGTGITGLPIRIRIGSANAGDYATRTYTDSTFDEAVLALQGKHGTEDDTSYHEATSVYVVATYPETFEENLGSEQKPRMVTRDAGQPVFGLEAQVYGRGRKYAEQSNCEVSMSSTTSNTSEARIRLEIFDLILRLAEAANTWPRCIECVAQDERRAARWEQSKQEAAAKAALHAGVHEAAALVAHDGYAPHSHEVRADHDGVPCPCGHPMHRGRVCKDCQRQTPRGEHGTPARVKAAGIMK